MKLSSKLHDYYDRLFAFGASDDKNVFVRNQTKFNIKYTIKMEVCCDGREFHYNISFGCIGFCGSMYPFLKVRKSMKYSSATNAEPSVHYYYSYASFAHACPEIAEGKTVLTSLSYGSLKGIEDYFKYTGVVAYSKYFKEHNCAYFSIEPESYDHCVVTIYPILKQFEFIRVVSVNDAYQRIMMYLTNILVKPDNPYIAPIDDAIKAESHGFDRFSFRKEKTSTKSKKR